MLIDELAKQPLLFWLCSTVLALLMLEAIVKRRRAWAIPALIGYATIGAWYLIELLYTPEGFIEFGDEPLENSYWQVLLFLIVFRLISPPLTRLISPARPNVFGQRAEIPAESFLMWVAGLWVILLALGTYRLDGDILGALFPIGSRGGARMWGRAAAGDAGSTGFLVATGGYLYTLTSASFGILLPFLRRQWAQLIALIFIGLSWPYFLLDGSRNIFLAVFLPSFTSFLLFGRYSRVTKGVIAAALYVVVDVWFRFVIAYRNVGFASVFSGDVNSNVLETKHLGLNMMSELCYINSFYKSGLLELSMGGRYLAELANFIPRAIWPDKPLIGIDYAILRGFGSDSSDIGVFATISSGAIGQGYLNFGPLFGPMAAAFLFASWIALLARFRQQQDSVLRLTLFLLGLGLTFNLGRDITLLVLWPIVFGYVSVRALEWYKASPGFVRARTPKALPFELQTRINRLT